VLTVSACFTAIHYGIIPISAINLDPAMFQYVATINVNGTVSTIIVNGSTPDNIPALNISFSIDNHVNSYPAPVNIIEVVPNETPTNLPKPDPVVDPVSDYVLHPDTVEYVTVEIDEVEQVVPVQTILDTWNPAINTVIDDPILVETIIEIDAPSSIDNSDPDTSVDEPLIDYEHTPAGQGGGGRWRK